jgi:hypothetical protein
MPLSSPPATSVQWGHVNTKPTRLTHAQRAVAIGGANLGENDQSGQYVHCSQLLQSSPCLVHAVLLHGKAAIIHSCCDADQELCRFGTPTPLNSVRHPQTQRPAFSVRQNKLLSSPVMLTSSHSQLMRKCKMEKEKKVRLWCPRWETSRREKTGGRGDQGDKYVYNRAENHTYTPRRLGFLPMHLCEHLLKRLLEALILSPLVEFTDKMAPNLEGVRGKSQGGVAEVLFVCLRSRQPISES